MPASNTAAVKRLERHPMPGRFDSARRMLGSLNGGFRWPFQLVMANLWLFEGLLLRVFLAKPSTASQVRTTTAMTVFRSGQKSNVMPSEATAVVNHRIMPGDTVADVRAHDEKVLSGSFAASASAPPSSSSSPSGGGPLGLLFFLLFAPLYWLHWLHRLLLALLRSPDAENLLYHPTLRPWGVRVEPYNPDPGHGDGTNSDNGWQPSAVSSTDHDAFRDLRASTLEVFGSHRRRGPGGRDEVRAGSKAAGVAVAPALMVGGTDSKHFRHLVRQTYRFNPVTLHVSEVNMFHGDDERIGVENYAQLVAFLRTFHLRSQERGRPPEHRPLASF